MILLGGNYTLGKLPSAATPISINTGRIEFSAARRLGKIST